MSRNSPLNLSSAGILSLLFLFSAAAPSSAIVLNTPDDFQAMPFTSMGWGIGMEASTPVLNQVDPLPAFEGDRALFMSTDPMFELGAGRLLVSNVDQWLGDWTAVGVARISMDVFNPTAGLELAMRIGIAGDVIGPQNPPAGDVYVTNAITVPADNMWHTLIFDVLADDFVPASEDASDIAGALSDVTTMRIIHNTLPEFRGESLADEPYGAFYLDNITALAAAGAVPGDYNGNLGVDAADYTVWRDTLGSTTDLRANGDNTGPSMDVIDIADYNFWKMNFPNGAGSGSLGLAAVPEPATWLMLLCISLSALSLRRRMS
jgi:hypothetical protein